MTQKGLDILSFLTGNGYHSSITAVVCSRDNNLLQDCYEEIRLCCEHNKLAFFDRSDTHIPVSEYSIAISWRWLIKDVANLIVLHDSKLPKYRGFAPLVNCLKNRESEIAVTALFASDDYDRGRIIFQSSQPIAYPIRIREAIDRIAANYKEVIQFIFDKLSNDLPLDSFEQDETLATYSLWLDEADYQIDWNWSSEKIKRFIDATGYPYESACCFVNGRKARIQEAEVVPDVKIENRTAGKIIFMPNSTPVVVCGQGLLKITAITWDDDGTEALPFKKFRSRLS